MSVTMQTIAAKVARRYDGICPRCATAAKNPGQPYCRDCRKADRRDRYSGERLSAAKPNPRNEQGLSLKQMEVLRLLCAGLETSQIAKRLQRSPQTVKHSRSAMLRITGCLTSAHLCYWAAKQGLV